MLEVVQTDHQMNGLGRSAHVRRITILKSRLKPWSVYLFGQQHQLVLRIEHLVKMGLEQQ